MTPHFAGGFFFDFSPGRWCGHFEVDYLTKLTTFFQGVPNHPILRGLQRSPWLLTTYLSPGMMLQSTEVKKNFEKLLTTILTILRGPDEKFWSNLPSVRNEQEKPPLKFGKGTPKGKDIVFQPSIFRCKLAVSLRHC